MRARFCMSPVGALLIAMSLTSIGAAGPAEQEPANRRLPLKKLVLFNSGVGYFEHRATVDGDARIAMAFNADDINDLLKSMVLRDLGGGSVSTVTYNSRDPVSKTLSTFSLDLTNNPTLADLLNQARGEPVEVEALELVAGTILGVEAREEPAGENRVVTVHYVNLLTPDGLRRVALSNVRRIKLTNEKLNAELQQALAILAMGHSSDKKTVTLDFRGAGKREVEVGYIQEAPIWKTTYRLVLDDDGKPYLQAWAIVENTTEQDWENVSLTLVSGRPISFRMNLYDPLFLDRPLVQHELFASIGPVTHDTDLLRAGREFQRQLIERRLARDAESPQQIFARMEAAEKSASGAREAAGKGLSWDSTTRSVAIGDDIGELFQYRIEAPVTLPRRQSALLPIASEAIEGEKLSIYNTSVHARYPLNALRLKNTTGLHLMQGPITVFDGGAYAGDARIEDIAPGAERLVSYALDLDVEMGRDMREAPREIITVKLVKGLLHSGRKRERTTTYLMKNSSGDERVVLIEHPREASWKLVAPEKPTESTRELYRFAKALADGETHRFEVKEEQVINEQIALDSLDDNSVKVYLQSTSISDDVRQALGKLIERKQAIAELTIQKQKLEKQLATIAEEQQRIRQNMGYLDRTSELYVRYVKKFGQQEDEVEKIRQENRTVEAQLQKKQADLEAFLATLDIS